MTFVCSASATVPVPTGTPMAGFAARLGPSSGVHDPLTVRAVCLDELCWVAIDVCGLHEDTCAEIAARVARAVPGSSVLDVRVSATHTHSGPCVVPGRLGGDVPELRQSIIDTAVKAVARAATSARDQPAATLTTVSAPVPGVAFDRRHGVAITPDVQAVLAWDGDRVRAALVVFPCHPVVLGADNTMITGDFPFFLRSALEQSWPGAEVLIVTGCAGDVNTGHTTTSSVAQSDSSKRTFTEARRIGETIATALRDRVPASGRSGITTDADHAGAVRSARTIVELDLTPLDDDTVDEAAARRSAERWRAAAAATDDVGQSALLQIWAEWAERRRADDPRCWSAPVSVARLPTGWLIGLPGEPFLGVADAIRAELGDDAVVIGYTDGCPGYFPLRAAYADGGYEVAEAHRYYGMPAPFASGSAERLVEAALGLAAGLR